MKVEVINKNEIPLSRKGKWVELFQKIQSKDSVSISIASSLSNSIKQSNTGRLSLQYYAKKFNKSWHFSVQDNKIYITEM